MNRLFIMLLGVVFSLPVFAYDSLLMTFDYTYEGQTLRFRIDDEIRKTCHTIKPDEKLSGEVVIPSHPKDGDVEYTLIRIGNDTFSNFSEITSVEIPETVVSIGQACFVGCSGLTSLTLPASVNSIGENAFQNCVNLTEIDLPEAITEIPAWAFSHCSSLKEIILPETLTSIGNLAFEYCTSLTSIEIPASVTAIGKAFEHCDGLKRATFASIEDLCKINFASSSANPMFYTKSLLIGDEEISDLIIPESVSSIGQYAFAGCESITSVVIPETVTTIGSNAFMYCTELTDVTIEDSETTLEFGDDVFNDVYILKLYLGRNISHNSEITYGTFANAPFYYQTDLEELTIGSKVTEIGEKTFAKSKDLTSITCQGLTPPTIYEDTFSDAIYSTATVKVPAEAKEAYEQSDIWKNFNIMTADKVPVESITLDPPTWKGVAEETFIITATVNPDDATNQQLEWSSSDPEVATVDETGNVKVLQTGTCVITAAATDGSGVTATCTLNVTTGSNPTEIDEIETEEAHPVEIYNLTGVRINVDRTDSLTPGIYIIRNRTKTSKLRIL